MTEGYPLSPYDAVYEVVLKATGETGRCEVGDILQELAEAGTLISTDGIEACLIALEDSGKILLDQEFVYVTGANQ